MKKNEVRGLKNKIELVDLLEYNYGKGFEDFVSVIMEGDEIWEYDDIKFLSGSAGYVIIRNDEVINCFITAIS